MMILLKVGSSNFVSFFHEKKATGSNQWYNPFQTSLSKVTMRVVNRKLTEVLFEVLVPYQTMETEKLY